MEVKDITINCDGHDIFRIVVSAFQVSNQMKGKSSVAVLKRTKSNWNAPRSKNSLERLKKKKINHWIIRFFTLYLMQEEQKTKSFS